MSTSYDPMDEHGSADDAGRLRARPPSVLHLVVGLVILGLAGLCALAASGIVSSDDTCLLPGLLVVAGAAGLLAALGAGRRSADR